MKKSKFIQTFGLCLSTSLISVGLNVCAMENNQMFVENDVKPNDSIMVESSEKKEGKEPADQKKDTKEEEVKDVSEFEEDKAENVIKLKPIIFGELPALSEEERKDIVDLSKDDRLGQLIDDGLVNLHSGRDMGDFKTLLTMTDQYGREKNVSEFIIRSRPNEYFRQDKETGTCYVKLGEKLYEAGRYFMPTLGEISMVSSNPEISRKGRIERVDFRCSSGLFNKMLDSGRIDLISMYTSARCIDNLIYLATFMRSRREPIEGRTEQALSRDDREYTKFEFARRCSWATLGLFHIPGLNGQRLEGRVFRDTGKDEINLLDGYEIATSGGMITEDYSSAVSKLGIDRKEDNDKFKFIVIEDATVSSKIDDEFEELTFNDKERKINIFMDTLSGRCNDGNESRYSREVYRLELKRHYLSLFNYCRAKEIKVAYISYNGMKEPGDRYFDIFDKKIEDHEEVLKDPEVREAMEKSGTLYIINEDEYYGRFTNFGSPDRSIRCPDIPEVIDKLMK